MTSRKAQGKGSYGYINARYIRNRSKKTGRHVTGGVQRVMYYNAYGNKEMNPTQEQRGLIYNEQGETVSYAKYKEWGIDGTKDHEYSYRMIISPKGHLLSDEDFVQVLNDSFQGRGYGEEFRLLVHRDTDHTHAHVLIHADKTMSRKELESWKRDLRQQIMEIEADRAQERAVKVPEVGKEWVDSPDTAVTESAGLIQERSRKPALYSLANYHRKLEENQRARQVEQERAHRKGRKRDRDRDMGLG